MSESTYAVIDNTNTVIAFAVCEDNNEGSYDVVKEVYGVDLLVKCEPSPLYRIGSHHKDGQIYPKSFILNEDGQWVHPIENPNDGNIYEWIENEDAGFWSQLTPFPSWTWDPVERITTPPTPEPNDGEYIWNEETLSWVPLIQQP